MPLKVRGFAVSTKPAWARGATVKEAVLGSWARTGLAAAAIVLILGAVAFLGATGQLSDLRYVNIPVIHPWPPSGYFQNPFNPTDRGDVLSRATADRVRADLTADGTIELEAVRNGDPTPLDSADSGNRLQKLRQVIADDNARGIYATEVTSYRSIVVGYLADPNLASAGPIWCVEEKGTSTIQHLSKGSGAVVQTEAFRFDDKFWMAWSGSRFLITDAEISNQPISGGS